MTRDSQRSLGPGVREVLGADALVEIADDHGVTVLRPVTAGRSLLVLHQRAPHTAAVLDEADRLWWLAGRAGAPPVVASGRADDGDEAIVVRLAHDATNGLHGHPMGPEALAREVAGALRALHELPVDGCPFDASVARLRAIAAERISRDLVSVAEAGPYLGRSPTELLTLHEEMGDGDPAGSFVHAGITAARLWLAPDGTLAFTGWRAAGVGDRHVDLAAAAALVTDLYGPALVAPMLDAYGLDAIDVARLDAAQLLVHLLA